MDERQARQELEEDEAKLNVDAEALREAKREVQDAASAARAAQREFERLETAIPKAEMEAESLKATAADLEARQAELDAAAKMSKEDKKHLEDLEKQISGFEKEVAKLQVPPSPSLHPYPPFPSPRTLTYPHLLCISLLCPKGSRFQSSRALPLPLPPSPLPLLPLLQQPVAPPGRRLLWTRVEGDRGGSVFVPPGSVNPGRESLRSIACSLAGGVQGAQPEGRGAAGLHRQRGRRPPQEAEAAVGAAGARRRGRGGRGHEEARPGRLQPQAGGQAREGAREGDGGTGTHRRRA